MKRYRTKSILVGAEQWFPPGHPEHVAIDGVHGVPVLKVTPADPDQVAWYIDDANGERKWLRPGCWIVRGHEDARLLMFSPVTFDQAFEEADEALAFDAGELWWFDEEQPRG